MNDERDKFILSLDIGGMFLSWSGVVLGVLFAVSDYYVDLETALSLGGTATLLHFYMARGGKVSLLLSVAGAVLTAYLSFGKILMLESLLLLLFGYFIIRLAKGGRGSSRVMSSVLDFLLYGPIAVYGAYFVCTHTFASWVFLFPSFSIGLLCLGVRRLETSYDKKFSAAMICLGVLFMVGFTFLRMYAPSHFMFMFAMPLLILLMVALFLYKQEDMYVFRLLFSAMVFTFAFFAGIGFLDIAFVTV